MSGQKKSVVTIVLDAISWVMVKKDPVCIPYEFSRLGFRSVLITGRALVRVPGVEVYELGLISHRCGLIPLYVCNILNSLASSLYHGLKLVRLLVRIRPYLVLTYYYPSLLPLLSLLSRLLKFRVVVKMDWDGIIRGSYVKRLARGLSSALFSKFADLVIIESYEALLNAARSVPSLYSKLRVVYNGYCDELLKPANVPREPIVLTVARVEPVKGVHDLITAFAKVANKHPQWKLRIVGPVTNREYFSKLVNLVNGLGLNGRVDFVGPISDSQLVEEYSRASIFVLPSYMESSGIARVEDMSFGLPVITSETGGSEVVRGVGIIIKPGDVDGLTRALEIIV
ncbi:glycosyl transferase group 1 [Thermogladius calderae 1633]|uniref:Glycosyl transferase group 1 n=1 Tax=Thermogladius calderae (strain DSM 22663 / VKM B-2946 / 1633) TaxID=1184251 RepID=I3TCX0_THEC1|nr:glycosyltransferase [Thermogladius calderae]AFK50608.1 glycosyl transferase group 1 [Thermogladius calderae 1633]